MTRQVRMFWSFTMLVALSAGCGDSTEPAPLGDGYEGTWTGTTSASDPVSFKVEGDAIKALRIKIKLTGNCGVTAIDLEFVPTYTVAAIEGDHFTTNEPDLVMTGTFTSNTAASGTASFTQTATSTGANCQSVGSTNWTAHR